MKQLRVIYTPLELTVGTLVQSGRDILFEYDPAFIGSGLQLSPYRLRLSGGLQRSGEPRLRDGLHGLFDDSLPDGWGLLLMDRYCRQQGRSTPLSPLERLAFIGHNGMGALAYEPAESLQTNPDLFDLATLADEAAQVYQGEAHDVIPLLAKAGGSPGGARPKILVGISEDGQMISGESTLPEGYRHWLIKFPAKREDEAGIKEYAWYLMALDAGLAMMESTLFRAGDLTCFGTQRFDRDGHRRIHMHTAANLVDADFRAPSLSYSDLCLLTADLTKNHADMMMMYRLMIFNVLAHNRDDHGKNFAFLMNEQGEWRLAPPYDLTFSYGPGGEHTADIAGKGKSITNADMLRVADDAGIPRNRAIEIIDQVETVTRRQDGYLNQARDQAHS